MASGEKRMIKNQEHMKSALDKIESFSEQSTKSLESIELHISESIISGTTEIKDELTKQTGILGGILKQLGGKKVDVKKDDIKKTQTSGNLNDLNDQVATTDITSFAKVLLLLGGAFWAFGKGIGSLEDISLKQVTVFGVMLLSIFGAINLIYREGMDLSIVQAVKMVVISAMLAMMITDVARILSKMETPSVKQLGMAISIGATMAPLAMYVIKTMDELSAFKGGAIMDLIEAPIVAMSSMGALIMLPMIALAIVATSNIFRMMPKGLSTSALALALGVGIAMLPIAHVFVAIFKALRGVMGTQRLYSAIASRIGAGTTNPLGVITSAGTALAIIPIVALTVVATAWVFQALPKTFKIPPLTWVLKLSIILLTFSAMISMMEKNMNQITGTSEKIASGFNGGTDIFKTEGKGKFFTLVGTMLMLGVVVVAFAYLFKALPDTYKSPPIKWILKVGIAMILFAKAVKNLLLGMKGKINKGRVALAGLAMLIMAASVVAIAYIFQALPPVNMMKSPPLGWTIKVGLAMLIFAQSIKSVMLSLKGRGSAKKVRQAGLALLILATSIVAVSYIFMALPDAGRIKAPSIFWTVAAGLAMYLFSKALQSIMVSLKGRNTGKKLTQAGIGMAILATSIVAVAVIFMALPESNRMKSPPISWTIKAGLSMWLFSKAISSIMESLKGRGKKKKLLEATAAMAVLAIGVVAVSYIFQLLPDPGMMKSPPLLWTISVGVAMVAFAYSTGIILNALKGRGKKSKLKEAMLAIGLIAISVVAVAYIFQFLPSKEKMKSPPLMWIISVGLSMAAFSMSLYLIMKLNIKPKDAIKSILVFNIIAASLVTVAWITQALPNDYKAPPIEWILQMTLALVAFGAVFAGIGFLHKKVKAGATAMIMAAASLYVIATAIDMWGNANIEWKDVAIIGATILGVGLLMALAGKGPMPKAILKGSLVMILATVPILLLASAMETWAAADVQWKDVATLSATVLGVGLVMALAGAGPVPIFIAFGALAMILATIPIILLASAMTIWTDAGVTWENVGILAALVTGLGVGMAAAGLAAPFIILGSAAMLVAGAALVTIANGYSRFAEVYKKSPEILTGTIVKDSITNLVEAFNIPLKQTARIYAVAPALILAGESLISIGKGLQEFAKMDLDVGVLGWRISTVITSVAESFAKVGEKYGSTFLSKGPVAKGINAVKGMGKQLSQIAAGVQDFADLKYKINGKEHTIPKSWLEPGGKISMNIRNVLKVVGDEFAALGKTNGETTWFSSGMIKKGINAVKGAGKQLSQIAAGIQDFANLKYRLNGKEHSIPEAWLQPGGKISMNIRNVLKLVGDEFAALGKTNGETTWFSSGMIKKGINAVKGAGKQLSQIVKGVQDFANLKYRLNGKEHSIPEAWLQPGGKISMNIRNVLRVIGEEFAALGRTNGETTWFSSGMIEKGINSIKGAGEQLSQIVKGVQDFANLKYTLDGKEHSIPEDWLQPGGKISMNIRNVLKLVGDEFAALGRTGGETGWFSSNMIEKGVESVEGAGKQLSHVANSIQDFANLKYTLNGKDYTIPEDWLQPGGKISMNIRNVLKVIGEEFAELGRTNGETGWFQSGMIEKGINAVKGAGEELGSIASAVMNFANLKYTLNGKEFTLTPDQLGVYDENGKLVKEGSVYRNMRNAIMAITGVLGDVGKSPDSDSGAWWWPGKSNLEKGKKAILGSTEGLGEIASFISSIGQIDDIDKLEYNVSKILMMLPSAIMKSYQHMTDSGIDIEDASVMLSKYPTELADAIERIAKHETAIEKVANSFSKMSTSIIDMKDAVQVIDENKLLHLSTMFDSVSNIQKLEAESKSKSGVAKDVAKGIEKGMDKVMEVIGKFSSTSKDQTTEIKKLAEKEMKIPGTNVVVDNKELVSAMKQMIFGLQEMSNKLDEVPVRVMNQNDSVQ